MTTRSNETKILAEMEHWTSLPRWWGRDHERAQVRANDWRPQSIEELAEAIREHAAAVGARGVPRTWWVREVDNARAWGDLSKPATRGRLLRRLVELYGYNGGIRSDSAARWIALATEAE